MKIIHIISSLEIGGAQKLVHDLALSQKSLGDDVTVLVYFNSGSMFEKELVTAGVSILSLGCEDITSIRIPIKIHRLLKNYDVAHVHLFPSLYQLALASVGTKTPLIYTEHSTYNRRRAKKFLRPVERIVYNRYSKIISISEQTQTTLLDWLRPHDINKFRVIFNGVDLDKYRNAQTKTVEAMFGRSGIPILMISRFVPAKDQVTLIKAIRYIENPDVFVAFAGNGKLIEDAKHLSKHLDVADRCIFLGNRNDIPDLIKSSVIGIQSSHWEGFGLTAVEFMAAGKPIIASSVDGLRQVVEGAGLLFNQGDEKHLASIINRLLSNSNLYTHISMKCETMANKYSLHTMIESYYETYTEIIKE